MRPLVGALTISTFPKILYLNGVITVYYGNAENNWLYRCVTFPHIKWNLCSCQTNQMCIKLTFLPIFHFKYRIYPDTGWSLCTSWIHKLFMCVWCDLTSWPSHVGVKTQNLRRHCLHEFCLRLRSVALIHIACILYAVDYKRVRPTVADQSLKHNSYIHTHTQCAYLRWILPPSHGGRALNQ